jgi:hypothetical protein
MNTSPQTESAYALLSDELDIVTGGIAASQVWVSPLAIHGFNPQPDPPAVWDSRAPLATTDHV